MPQVTGFYDKHPITERQILAALARDQKSPSTLVPEDLYPHDQDHYGGLAAVDRLIGATCTTASNLVLDVCSGLGGPARYVAQATGGRVVGIDLTASRAISAHRLTGLVGLTPQVCFANGDATRLPFAADSFDVAISQEAFLHIGDKPALFAELRRVLKPGGRLAFTDWLGFSGLDGAARQRLRDGIAANAIHEPDTYCGFLRDAGFADVGMTDLSTEWQKILKDRLEMFRSMGPDTMRRHGADAHARYIDAYEFFVARISDGDLGGGLFTATKPDA